MSETRFPSSVARVVGVVMLLIGASVFLIRLQHAGPYDFPEGGNLAGGLLSLLLGGWLIRDWLGPHRLAAPLGWAAIAASSAVAFFALYATFAELEEVVVLKASNRAGTPVDLRLWIVDRGDASWVTMPGSKADEHGLAGAQLEMLRQGELRCVVATRLDDREAVNAVHHARHEKYAVQRLATRLGLFARSAGAEQITLRLDPCPPD